MQLIDRVKTGQYFIANDLICELIEPIISKSKTGVIYDYLLVSLYIRIK